MSGRALRDIMAGIEHLPMPKPVLLAPSTAGFWRAKDVYVIRLHQTNILTFWSPEFAKMADGNPGKSPIKAHRIEVNPGSWFTPTTKARLCSFLPGFIVSSAGGEWVIYRPSDYINTVQPFTGPMSIVGGKLPPCPDNSIQTRLIETSITRFVKFAEWLNFQPPAGEKGSILLTQSWVRRHLREKWWRHYTYAGGPTPETVFDDPNVKPYVFNRTFTAAVLRAALARAGHRAVAYKLGSDRMKPALRKAVREYLRELTGLVPAAQVEDLQSIAAD
jgi:hypothetical protein